MKKARPGWIPVQERLPEMQEVYKGGPRTSAPVLFFDSVRGEVTLGRYEEHSGRLRGTGWWDDTQPDWANIQHRESLTGGVTHWMPLPAQPAPESGEKATRSQAANADETGVAFNPEKAGELSGPEGNSRA